LEQSRRANYGFGGGIMEDIGIIDHNAANESQSVFKTSDHKN